MAGPQQRNAFIPPTPEEAAQRRAERTKRRREIHDLERSLHALVLAEWGDEEGRREWRRINYKRRGRAKGSTRPAQDRNLAMLHDALMAAGSVRGLARLIKDKPHPALGDTSNASVEAIRKRIQRALNNRKKLLRAAREAGNLLAPNWDK